VKTGYVVGLAFNRAATHITLIRKNRPDWMAGQLNGSGGKIEFGETGPQAMEREFLEETGVIIPAAAWQLCALREDELARVEIYRCFDDAIMQARTMTDETVEVYATDDDRLVREGIKGLPMLLAHALNRNSNGILKLETARPK